MTPTALHELREVLSKATGIASGPNGCGKMKLVLDGFEPGDEFRLHTLLSRIISGILEEPTLSQAALLDEITALQASNAAMREACATAQRQLKKAADQFAFYADEHAKKRTADGDAKGATNHQWALACAKADHVCRAALTARTEGGE